MQYHDHALKNDLVRIVQRTHAEILEIYDTSFDFERKSDGSPITEADRRALDLITSELVKLDPSIPMLSEESTLVAYEVRKNWSTYWLIDPLDGTKEFIKRNGEFTVNIALIENHEPLLGVVGRPTKHTVYYGDAYAQKAWRIEANDEFPIQSRPFQHNKVQSIQSRRRADPTAEQFLAHLESEVGPISRSFRGSSLKFLALAEGTKDLYLQPGGTSEWDTAAAHAVLRAAGGNVMTLRGDPLRYNLTASVLNEPFIALADSTHAQRELILRHLHVFHS